MTAPRKRTGRATPSAKAKRDTAQAAQRKAELEAIRSELHLRIIQLARIYPDTAEYIIGFTLAANPQIIATGLNQLEQQIATALTPNPQPQETTP